MSIWDTLTGRKPKPSSSAGETLSSEPTTSFNTAAFDPSTASQDATSFLTAGSLPDASQLHPLAGLNQQTLDYLSLDESVLSDLPGSRSALPSRGWSDDLCYGTGTTYLTALMMGGAWGLIEGSNRIVAGAISGMIFKSTRGLRPMMISGGVVASVAGSWAVSEL